jgi:protein tyrosine phosphatase
MVWEQNVRLIGMLTTLVEGGRVKCDHYWPEAGSGPRAYGAVVVELTAESDCGSFVERTLVLRPAPGAEGSASGAAEGASVRTVTQLHLTAWPDHGVPADPDLVLAYLRRAQEIKRGPVAAGPVVVHCSAGIGRTGVHMLLEAALACFEAKMPAELDGMLAALRTQRMGLVQTEPQFAFCRDTLARVLAAGGAGFAIVV